MVEVGTEVVRAALGGVISQVEDGKRGDGTIVVALVAVGIELAHQHLAHIVVGQLRQVALDMCRGKRTAPAGKERIDIVPRQQRTVEAARQRGLVVVVGDGGGHAGDNPRGGGRHIYLGGGVLKVVQIRGIVLRAVALAGDELGKLGIEGYLRGLRDMQERYLVEHIGEPLALLLPVEVHSPERIVERLGSHVHLGGEGLLREMLQGTAHLEILGKLVLPIDAKHGLALLPIV